jgi:hypothetical protein
MGAQEFRWDKGGTARVMIKKTEMGRACRMYGGKQRCIQGFSGKNLKEGDHLKDSGVDGRIILKLILEK